MLFSVMAKLWLPLKCRLVFVFLMFLFWSSPFHADKRIKERDKGTLGTHVFIKFARNCLPLLPRPMFWCPRPSDSLSYCLFKGWRPRWCAGRIDNNFARCLPFTCVFSRFGFYLLNLQIYNCCLWVTQKKKSKQKKKQYKDTYKIKVNSECNVNDSKVKFDVFYFLNDTLHVKKYKCWNQLLKRHNNKNKSIFIYTCFKYTVCLTLRIRLTKVATDSI